jgi:hypothetical protein
MKLNTLKSHKVLMFYALSHRGFAPPKPAGGGKPGGPPGAAPTAPQVEI